MAPPSFRSQLIAALRDAVPALRKGTGKERLIAFALYTSGESDFDYVCASACTEEGLARLVARAKARQRGVERTEEDLKGALRWSACDWEHHDFYEAVGSLKLPPAGDAKRDAKVYADFVKALQTLDAEGLFGKGAARSRLTLAVMCGDMSADFLLKGVKKLNPPTVVKRYVENNTPARLYARLDKLSASERRRAYLDLYLALALDRNTADAAAARRVGITYFGHLDDKLITLGTAIVEDLVTIVETHAFGPAFNVRDSEAWKRHGAVTAEMNLATSAVFLAGMVGAFSDTQVARFQQLLARRQAQDAAIEAPASTLTENIARVLHGLHPERFPDTVMDPKNNRLLNFRAYL